MTLKEKLDAIKAQSQTRIPPEARAILEPSIDDLRKSGIVDRVVRVGDARLTLRCPTRLAAW